MVRLLVIIALILLSSDANAQRRPDRIITITPTPNPSIILPLNGLPVEVRGEDLERYRCQRGHLIATTDGQAARTASRRLTLRCIL